MESGFSLVLLHVLTVDHGYVSVVTHAQELTFVLFSAQLEPCLTHQNTLHTLNSP
jgi:hypothetical protein